MYFSLFLEPRVQDKARSVQEGRPAGFRVQARVPDGLCVPRIEGVPLLGLLLQGHEPSEVFCFPDPTSPSCAITLRFQQMNLAVTETAKPQRSQETGVCRGGCALALFKSRHGSQGFGPEALASP